ncbi:MAG: hypothetical protein JSS49_15795 [Planctomycetes bacterium]|nr:hypothetical protein [Planctomycetota bacterium]
MQHEMRIDRRQFTRRLATGTGLVAGLATVTIQAAEIPPAPKLPEDPPKTNDGPAVPPAEILLLSYLLQSHPNEHFDEDAVQGIFRDIRGDVARGKVLANFPLRNSDEPAFVFAAHRSADGIPFMH